MSMRPAKTRISPGMRPVWSESSLCARCVAKNPMLLHADSEDWSDWADAQADLSLRWAHSHFVGFVMSRLIYTRTQISLPLPPRTSNGQSLNRFSRYVTHMASYYFLVYFHCSKQYKKANKTDQHLRYPFFHCYRYRHYRNSDHVSCRVILTCAKIRFVLKLDLC